MQSTLTEVKDLEIKKATITARYSLRPLYECVCESSSCSVGVLFMINND